MCGSRLYTLRAGKRWCDNDNRINGAYICAVGIGGTFFGLKSNKRANDAEVEKHATSMTSVIVKLEHISTGVTEIKSELGSVKQDLKDVTEKVIIAEQIAKSAQKRLDEHIGKSNV